MATLARLMQPGPSQLIDPATLADSRENISGKISIAEMPRICGLLCEDRGEVLFELEFARNERRQILINGQFSCSVIMQCQRCLDPVEIQLDRHLQVAIVENEDEATDLPKSVEPFVLQDKSLSLVTFIEDELLLGVPLAASHSNESCRLQTSDREAEIETHRPFEILKDLKLKK